MKKSSGLCPSMQKIILRLCPTTQKVNYVLHPTVWSIPQSGRQCQIKLLVTYLCKFMSGSLHEQFDTKKGVMLSHQTVPLKQIFGKFHNIFIYCIILYSRMLFGTICYPK